MTSTKVRVLLVAGAALAVSGCLKAEHDRGGTASAETKNVAAATSNDPISSAESAAPATVAHDASVVTVDANGAMTTLRKGKNGWTCMPDAPDTRSIRVNAASSRGEGVFSEVSGFIAFSP